MSVFSFRFLRFLRWSPPNRSDSICDTDRPRLGRLQAQFSFGHRVKIHKITEHGDIECHGQSNPSGPGVWSFSKFWFLRASYLVDPKGSVGLMCQFFCLLWKDKSRGKRILIHECRCNERLKAISEGSTRLVSCDTGWLGGLEHLTMETRLRDARFESVKGECFDVISLKHTLFSTIPSHDIFFSSSLWGDLRKRLFG